MNILYGIQGTGNGHISRAKAILPHLLKKGNVDILISGTNSDVNPGYPVTYRYNGLSYTFGKKGGIDYLNTVLNLHPAAFIKNVRGLPVEKYDLVISDFEPVTAWSCWLKNKQCIGLSHQASFLSDKTPRPYEVNFTGEFIFRNYAPVTNYIGFHFQKYDSFIYTPVIRREVRQLQVSEGEHVTIYLPAYSHDLLIHYLRETHKEVHIFSKQCREYSRQGKIHLFPVCESQYLDSLAGCRALICGAGFEAPSEGLFLGKRMMCIPMRDQYEQSCNAAALGRKDVMLAENADKSLPRLVEELISVEKPEPIAYNDITEEIIDKLMDFSSCETEHI